MTIVANAVDGAIVQADGRLLPVAMAAERGLDPVRLPDGDATTPIALAMTRGRQISAARRAGRAD